MSLADKLRAKLPHASDAFMKANAHLLDEPVHSMDVLPSSEPVAAKKRTRQSAKGPNKLERAFFVWLQTNWPNHEHHEQAVTFRLANGVRLTPDIMSFSRATGKLLAWETKGPFARDDSIVKLKVAAAVYPQIWFRLVTKTKDGGWDIQDVLP